MADEKKTTKKARVLVDHAEFRVNDIVSGDDAAAGIAAGWADGDPAAIAYAEKLRHQSQRDEAGE